MIELDDVHKQLDGREVLKGMTLTVAQGMNYVLMGPSGSGKSVTLRHIVGILKPDRGKVLVDGQDVGALDRLELMTMRKRLGYLFQNGALINWLTVAENVALPLREHSKLSRGEVDDRVREVLQLVGMEESAGQHPPEISGGMRLRTGLARALVTQPEYVLYDEPNAGLDPLMSQQIIELIVEVRDRLGVTGLIVTHSSACARQCADRIGILEEGRIALEGTLAELLQSGNPLARQFLSGGAD